MPHRWLILRSGGHGRTVADAVRAQGDAVVGFLDDSRPAGELVAGVPVLGPLRLAWDVKTLQCLEGASSPDRIVVVIGNPALRQRWQQVLEAAAAPVGVVVHPRACVSPSAQLDPGCVVLLVPWSTLLPGSSVACLSTAAPLSTMTPSAAPPASWASTPPWPAGHVSCRWLHWRLARCLAAVKIALLSWSWQRKLPISMRASAALAPRADQVAPRFALTAMRLSLWRATGSTGGWLVPQNVAHKRTQCGL